MFQNIVALHEVCHGTVAHSRLFFRLKHRFVQMNGIPAAKFSGERQKIAEGVLAVHAAVGGGNGSRVNHGIERVCVFCLQPHQRIKCVAGRLHPHFAEHPVITCRLQSHDEGEGFGNALDGKFLMPVACGVNLPVGGDDAGPQLVRISLGQLGDIGGHLACVKERAGIIHRVGQRFFNQFIASHRKSFSLFSAASPLNSMAELGKSPYD